MVLCPILKLRHLSFQRKRIERFQRKSFPLFRSFASRKFECFSEALLRNKINNFVSIYDLRQNFFMATFK